MIRVRVYRQDEKKPVKAYRTMEPGAKLAREIFELITNLGAEEVTIHFDEAVKGVSFSRKIMYEELNALAPSFKQHPAYRSIIKGMEVLRGAPDYVQEAINQGRDL